MATVTCPNCAMPVDPGRFCPYCGTELVAAESVAAAGAGAASSPEASRETADLPPLPEIPPLPDLPTLPRPPRFAFPPFGRDGAADDPRKPLEVPPDRPFALSCRTPDVMWKGENAVVAFRFKAREDCFSGLTLRLRNGADELGRQVLGRRPDCLEQRFVFNVKPRFAGACIALSVDVICTRDGFCPGEEEIYTAPFDVTVKEERQNPIHVGDIRIGSGNAIYKGLNFNFLNSSREDHTAVTAHERILAPKLEKFPRKLSLVCGEKAVQLLAVEKGECLTFGRSSDTTVPIRVFDPETKKLDRETSRKISGVHFRLQLCDGGRLKIFDGAEGKPSTNGLSCGETWITADGRCSFRPGDVHELILGGPQENYIGLAVEVFGDDYGLSGFRMTRDDGADLTVLGVVGCVPFGAGAETVVWDGGSFVFRDAGGRRKNLLPGMSVSLDGVAYDVCVHRKCYV